MGSDVSYYFGPYMKVHVDKIDVPYISRVCTNHHKVGMGDIFCTICGAKGSNVEKFRLATPSLYDIYEEEGYEHDLYDCTPMGIHSNENTIIVRDNTGDVEEWLSIQGVLYNPEMLTFPSDRQVQSMVQSFSDRHKHHIKEILASESVKQIEVVAGFLLHVPY